MSVAVLGLIGTGIGALITAGGWAFNFFSNRQTARNTPVMQQNAQAQTDLRIDQEAEEAIEASDKGDLTKERLGDAEK